MNAASAIVSRAPATDVAPSASSGNTAGDVGSTSGSVRTWVDLISETREHKHKGNSL
jgi:hypothetical protein